MPVAYRDYYGDLGVSRDASEEDIRRAYRALARQYHPDVNKDPEAGERFREISEAYEVLRDAEKRSRYDRFGADWKAGQDVPRDAGPGFSGFGDASGGFAGFGNGFDDIRVDIGGGEFSDFFEGLFGRGRRRGGASARDGFPLRGGDAEATLELTLEQAVHGGRQRIRLADGRDYEVNVPAGVRDGQRIRLGGEGSPGSGGGPAGDLFLRVRIKPHPRLRVDGSDLYVDLRVAPWEAALGATVQVHTLDGFARVRVPAGSSSGRRLRIRNEGLPRRDGGRGDLYAVLMIAVPRHLTDEERSLFEQLASVSQFDPRARR